MNVFQMSGKDYRALCRHLLAAGEQAAFVFAEAAEIADGVTFRAAEHYLAKPEDFNARTGDHLELADDAQQRVIKMAWDRRMALVEFHSHSGFGVPACFSPLDGHGLREFVPHVRWRLKGQPYAAFVFGQRSFDALVWRGRSGMPEPLRRLEVGRRILLPTGLTLGNTHLMLMIGADRAG